MMGSPYFFDNVTTSATVYTGIDSVVRAFDSWDHFCFYTRISRGPVWGWWAEFYPKAHPTCPPVRLVDQRFRRPQARACILNTRRWKRRRFLHSLRATA